VNEHEKLGKVSEYFTISLGIKKEKPADMFETEPSVHTKQ